MIKKSDDLVWVKSDFGEQYLPLGAGITKLEEKYQTALLETPNINSSLCRREILYHTGQLEFEGIRLHDDAQNILLSKRLTRGSDAKVTLIIANRMDVLSETMIQARKVTGFVCIENPGTGEGCFGSKIKGKIVYAEMPVRGVFNEEHQVFG